MLTRQKPPPYAGGSRRGGNPFQPPGGGSGPPPYRGGGIQALGNPGFPPFNGQDVGPYTGEHNPWGGPQNVNLPHGSGEGMSSYEQLLYDIEMAKQAGGGRLTPQQQKEFYNQMQNLPEGGKSVYDPYETGQYGVKPLRLPKGSDQSTAKAGPGTNYAKGADAGGAGIWRQPGAVVEPHPDAGKAAPGKSRGRWFQLTLPGKAPQDLFVTQQGLDSSGYPKGSTIAPNAPQRLTGPLTRNPNEYTPVPNSKIGQLRAKRMGGLSGTGIPIHDDPGSTPGSGLAGGLGNIIGGYQMGELPGQAMGGAAQMQNELGPNPTFGQILGGLAGYMNPFRGFGGIMDGPPPAEPGGPPPPQDLFPPMAGSMSDFPPPVAGGGKDKPPQFPGTGIPTHDDPGSQPATNPSFDPHGDGGTWGAGSFEADPPASGLARGTLNQGGVQHHPPPPDLVWKGPGTQNHQLPPDLVWKGPGVQTNPHLQRPPLEWKGAGDSPPPDGVPDFGGSDLLGGTLPPGSQQVPNEVSTWPGYGSPIRRPARRPPPFMSGGSGYDGVPAYSGFSGFGGGGGGQGVLSSGTGPVTPNT